MDWQQRLNNPSIKGGVYLPFVTITYRKEKTMYNNLYELLNTFIYDGVANNASATEIACTLMASFGCILLVGLPFYVVYAILRRFL